MDLNSFYDELNSAQREAVFHSGEQPLLVLAGAGSGKTRVIALRIAHLIKERGLLGSSILGFTFTNKAAEEMRDRVTLWVGLQGITLRTFHSFGAWFLRLYAPLIGMEENFSIWDRADIISALKNLRYRVESQGRDKEEAVSWRKLSLAILKAKEAFWERDEDLERAFWDIPNFVSIFRDYEKHREDSNAFDFSDLIRIPVKILQSYVDIKAKMQNRFKAIFVDEYQDTNYSQFLLLRELVGEHTKLCAVGDEDQCIYGFRGARMENILQFQDSFKGARIIRLEENYRSTANIISATSSVISHNKNRLGKSLFTHNPAGEKIAIYFHETSEIEARFWAEKLKKEKGDGRSRAIIYRTNAQSLSFEKALREAKVPYQLVGALRFYEREEIKDALAYLKCIDNPRDQVAFLRIVNKPPRGIGKKGMLILTQLLEKDNFDVWLVLKKAKDHLSFSVGNKLEKLLIAVNNFRDDLYKLSLSGRTSENLSIAMSCLFMELELFSYYKKLDEREYSEKLLNLEEFIASAVDYNSSPEDLRIFLENTELSPMQEEAEGELGKYIQPTSLLTAHSSKGLEFDEVLISGVEGGLFPLGCGEMDTDNNLEEERRLFYVAMTRARFLLSFSFCRARFFRGKRFEVETSPFLRELPSEITKFFKTYNLQTQCKVVGHDFSYGDLNWKNKREESYNVGDLVFHKYWGEGRIIEAWHRKGEFYVRIIFKDRQEKVLMPEYEKLEKI